MEKANNIEQAEDFFMSHHSDNVICVKDGVEKEVECYQDACAYFE